MRVFTGNNPEADENVAIRGGTGGAYLRIDGPNIEAVAGTGATSYGVKVAFSTKDDGSPSYSLYLDKGTLYAQGHTAALFAYAVRDSYYKNTLSIGMASTTYTGDMTAITNEMASWANCKKYQQIQITGV